jgi:hypothetical protein
LLTAGEVALKTVANQILSRRVSTSIPKCCFFGERQTGTMWIISAENAISEPGPDSTLSKSLVLIESCSTKMKNFSKL